MKIRKAVIPVAGFGTRFLPVTRAIPKVMIPVLDRPAIHYTVEEAIHAGIEHIVFVIALGQEAVHGVEQRPGVPLVEARRRREERPHRHGEGERDRSRVGAERDALRHARVRVPTDDDVPVLEVGNLFMALDSRTQAKILEFMDYAYQITKNDVLGIIHIEHENTNKRIGMYTIDGLSFQ